MIILDGIQLPAGLLWSDEFAASRVAQSVRRTLDGSVVVFYGQLQAGLPITLESESDAGWFTRAQIEALALRAVGAPDSAQWSTVRAALLADPWFVPSSAGAVAPSPAAPVWRVGEFVGFGGPFAFPPQLVAVEDGFVVVSADRTFHLIADAFGVALLPAANGEILGTPMTPVQGDLAIKGKTLIADGQRVTLDLPEGAIDVAANAHTLAVSSPYSYLIRLFPRRQPLA